MFCSVNQIKYDKMMTDVKRQCVLLIILTVLVLHSRAEVEVDEGSSVNVTVSESVSDIQGILQSGIGQPVTDEAVEEIQKNLHNPLIEMYDNVTGKENISNAVVEITENVTANTTHPKRVTCIQRNITSGDQLVVEIVNATVLQNILEADPNITSRTTPSVCTLLLFFARWCQFCSLAAPHVNALPRAFPGIRTFAVDATKHHALNTQYGVVGLPTLMLFHNGMLAAKFNESTYKLEQFAKFVTKYTGIEPEGLLNVTSADFKGPLPSTPVYETDQWLVIAWLFIVLCSVFFFVKSNLWKHIVEAVQNTWREAAAQHEHEE